VWNFYRNGSGLSNVKILINLSHRVQRIDSYFSQLLGPHGEGCIGTEEFMTEDLGKENIVGDVFGFEPVATDGAVGAAEVAGFPG